MVFGLGLALVAAIAAAILPAIQASRPGLGDALKAGQAGGLGRFGWRRAGVQQALVVGEIALALVLLAGAGLLTRSFSRLNGLDPGFEPAGVLTLRYAAAEGDLAVRDPVEFRRAAVERLSALPGVTSVFDRTVPAAGPALLGQRGGPGGRPQAADRGSAVPIGLHPVTTEHFRTLGIPILRGRSFSGFDRPGAPRAVLLNETAAKRLFPGQDPIGHRLSAASFYFGGGDSLAEVIGVVKDVRYGEYDAGARAGSLFPAERDPGLRAAPAPSSCTPAETRCGSRIWCAPRSSCSIPTSRFSGS